MIHGQEEAADGGDRKRPGAQHRDYRRLPAWAAMIPAERICPARGHPVVLDPWGIGADTLPRAVACKEIHIENALCGHPAETLPKSLRS